MPWTSPPDDPVSHPGDGHWVRTLGPVGHDHRPFFCPHGGLARLNRRADRTPARRSPPPGCGRVPSPAAFRRSANASPRPSGRAGCRTRRGGRCGGRRRASGRLPAPRRGWHGAGRAGSSTRRGKARGRPCPAATAMRRRRWPRPPLPARSAGGRSRPPAAKRARFTTRAASASIARTGRSPASARSVRASVSVARAAARPTAP